MPTVTTDTVSAVTIIPESNNIVYEILKQAQVDKAQANVAHWHPTGNDEHFIQIS